MSKHQTNPDWRTFFSILDQHSRKESASRLIHMFVQFSALWLQDWGDCFQEPQRRLGLLEWSCSLPHPPSIFRTSSVESPQLKCKYPHLVSPSSRPVPFEGLYDRVHSGWSSFLKASCAMWHNLVIHQWLSHHTCRSLPHSGLPRWNSGTESACQHRRCKFDPWVGKIP